MATANDILTVARKELGTKESPAGSNKVKYNTWYYWGPVSGSAYPWCMVFVQWVFDQCGARELLPAWTASCTILMNAAKKKGIWVTKDYQPGDILIYDWGGDRKPDHTGILEKVLGNGKVQAIEGNTSKSNDSNGGEVMRRERRLSQILGAVRPKYAIKKEEDTMTDKQAYEAVMRYSATLKLPENLKKEFQEAIDMGITDGSNPCKLVPAWRAIILAKRAVEKAKA